MTARAGELDRVVGLDYGADDYLAKPFGLAELQARVRALLRRTSAAERARRAVAPTGLRIDVDARRVYAGTDEVPLTGKEFEVLNILAANRDKVVSRGRLMADVWDENWYGSTKTLDVTIGRLRQKLESVGVTDRVVAVRGVGFRLEGGSTGCVSASPSAFVVLTVVLLLGAGLVRTYVLRDLLREQAATQLSQQAHLIHAIVRTARRRAGVSTRRSSTPLVGVGDRLEYAADGRGPVVVRGAEPTRAPTTTEDLSSTEAMRRPRVTISESSVAW